MKRFSLLLTGLTLLFSLACKSGMKEPAEEPIPAASFKLRVTIPDVKDFDVWKSHYMEGDSFRTAYGLTRYVLGRDIDNPNRLLVGLKIANMAKAKEYDASPELKVRRDSSGVIGTPETHWIDVVRLDTTQVASKTRVLAWHHVKDYDAWLKVYDGETRKIRSEHGLVDRGLGRGIDDPNMVYIAMYVSDMEKAKARLMSEELKALMVEGGVDGPVNSVWYNVVD